MIDLSYAVRCFYRRPSSLSARVENHLLLTWNFERERKPQELEVAVTEQHSSFVRRGRPRMSVATAIYLER